MCKTTKRLLRSTLLVFHAICKKVVLLRLQTFNTMSQTLDSPSILSRMAKDYTRKDVVSCEQLPLSGSHRRYYRLALADGQTLIGAFNDDIAENKAFFSYTDYFTRQQLPVPQLYVVAPDQQHYLQEDCGKQTLYDLLCAERLPDGSFSPKVLNCYEQVVHILPQLQLSGKKGFDFSVAYPRAAFDRQSMQWDLNYFKYYFLKLVNVPFNEQLLEDDYNRLMDYLLTADSDYFLYRDFQSRNIMVRGDEVFFIDYQGGRRGALQYDLASLLYDGKADMPPAVRTHLLEIYLDALAQHVEVSREVFMSYFQGFVLIRILQAMGTYGYRGYFERKSHFLQSVPYAVRNLAGLLDTRNMPIQLPELTRALRAVIASDFVKPYCPSDQLTVRVQSFSFRRALPMDPSGNGGGFVFDCRALPNPGREPQYRSFTGKDTCVVEYLERYPEVEDFKRHVFALVDAAVDNYRERRFNHLMVSFGCTGGQHRSVYFAEQTARHLLEMFPDIQVELRHTARENG